MPVGEPCAARIVAAAAAAAPGGCWLRCGERVRLCPLAADSGMGPPAACKGVAIGYDVTERRGQWKSKQRG